MCDVIGSHEHDVLSPVAQQQFLLIPNHRQLTLLQNINSHNMSGSILNVSGSIPNVSSGILNVSGSILNVSSGILNVSGSILNMRGLRIGSGTGILR